MVFANKSKYVTDLLKKELESLYKKGYTPEDIVKALIRMEKDYKNRGIPI